MQMYGFGMFDVMETMFPILFIIVLGIIVFVILRNVGEFFTNNASPVETAPATVVAKRSQISGGPNTHHSTTYFVTFQEQSGERRELRVSGKEFGLLVEGDTGILTHQGTRYKGFAVGQDA